MASDINKPTSPEADAKAIRQVVGLLDVIDKKIMSLHTISTKDFMGFNELLKEYHKKAIEITRGSADMFAFFDELDSFAFVAEGRALLEVSQSKVRSIRQLALQVTDAIGKSQNAIGQIFVPINNFRQNLMTLKFLFANVKLTQWISDPESAAEVGALVDDIAQQIQNTKEDIPTIEINVRMLLAQLNILFEQTQKILCDNLIVLEQNTLELGKAIKSVEEIKDNSYSASTESNMLGQRCFKNLDSVVTNMQYQDIIRQKMEHIQLTHKSIINDLDTSAGSASDSWKEYMKQIPEIAEIQAAQLMYSNREYQNAIESIAQKLSDTHAGLRSITSLCALKSGELSRVEALASTISRCVDEIHRQRQHLSDFARKLAQNSARYQAMIEEQITRKQEMRRIEEGLAELSEKVKALRRDEKRELGFFANQIDPLLMDIRNTRLLMEGLIPDASQESARVKLLLLSRLIEASTSEAPDRSEDPSREARERLSKVARGRHVTSDGALMKESMEKATYYEVFDKEVESIIGSLNEIYKMLAPYIDSERMPRDLLSGMENLYTMKSERDTHSLRSAQEAAPAVEDDISDIEFF